MKNNIYDLLNNNTVNLEELEKERFSDLEMAKLKRNFNKSINKKSRRKSVAAAVIAGTMFITLIGTDAGAEVVEGIKSIGSNIASSLGITRNIDKYVQGVGVEKTVGEVTIKINDVVLNNDELIVSTTTRYKNLIDVKNGDMHIWIEDLYVYESGNIKPTIIDLAPKKFTYSEDGYVRNETTKYALPNKLTNKDTKFMIRISDYVVRKGGEEKVLELNATPLEENLLKGGILELEFTANGEELAKDTKEITLNKEIKIDNKTVATLETLSYNAIDTIIDFKLPIGNGPAIELVGKDDKGNQIKLAGWSNNDEGIGELRLDRRVGMPSEDATKLILTPTIKYISETGEVLSTNTGEEITIDLTK